MLKGRNSAKSSIRALSGAEAASPWQTIHRDLFQTFVKYLDLQERVSLILVCKQWLSLALEDLPLHQKLIIHVHAQSADYLLSIQRLGVCLETVEIILKTARPPRTMMPQLLTVLATSCPNLRRLSIKVPFIHYLCYKMFDNSGKIDDGGDWDTWAGCLPLLRQLEVLSLDGLRFRPWSSIDDENDDRLLDNLLDGGEDYAVEDFFRGLNLKELYVLCAEECNILDPTYCFELGHALTALTNLTKLYFEYNHLGSSDEEDIEERDWDNIAYNVSLLHSLRSVTLDSNERMLLCPQWQQMSNLTALDLKGQLERCYEINSLPALRSLSLHYLMPNSASMNPWTPLSLGTLTGLTALAIESSEYLKKEDILRLLLGHDSEGVRGLSSFSLSVGDTLTDVDNGILTSMPSLTKLSLRGNALSRMPPGVAMLSGLKVLEMRDNASLWLTLRCVSALKRLPQLGMVATDKAVWLKRRGAWFNEESCDRILPFMWP